MIFSGTNNDQPIIKLLTPTPFTLLTKQQQLQRQQAIPNKCIQKYINAMCEISNRHNVSIVFTKSNLNCH